jgi:hypothetical protein
MTWFKLDDQGAFHRKVLAAGNEAYGALVRMGQHSSAQLSDGFVDDAAALLIAGRADVISRLLQVGFLEQADGGYVIHDFHDYNPTSEEVKRTRESRKESGRRGGLSKALANAKQSPSKRLANAKHVATALPEHVSSKSLPRPDPAFKSPPKPPPGVATAQAPAEPNPEPMSPSELAASAISLPWRQKTPSEPPPPNGASHG